jgi:hypothetical protein
VVNKVELSGEKGDVEQSRSASERDGSDFADRLHPYQSQRKGARYDQHSANMCLRVYKGGRICYRPQRHIAAANEIQIFDSLGHQVGNCAYDNTLRRKLPDRIIRMLDFWRVGYESNVLLFYKSNDCSGQRYFQYNGNVRQIPVVPQAFYEDTPSSGSPVSSGKTMWAMPLNPSPESFIAGSSWNGHETTGNIAGCNGEAQSAAPELFVPAIAIDTASRGFLPPFCQSTLGPVACR